jgi:phosphoglycolate phosphatase
MTNKFDLIVFDLDGTLVETAPEIADAVNDTLLRFDLPQVSQTQVERWIGHGTRELLIQAVASSSGSDPAFVRSTDGFELIASVFNTHYNQRCGTRSQPYPQALEALNQLHDAGVKLAIVTNKEAAYTRRVLDAHGLTSRFEVLVCGDTLATKKPDPSGAAHCLKVCGVTAQRALFVGDSSIDVATARNAGLPVWVFTHGYNMGEPIAASQPDRVLEGFKSLMAMLKA